MSTGNLRQPKISCYCNFYIIMYDNNMSLEISQQLRRRRGELGLSLKDVARRAGTSTTALSRYEHGWTRFETYTLQKLALALNCDLTISLSPRDTVRPPRCTAQEAVTRLGRLFWDHDLKAADLAAYPVWVVERVLDYGTLADVDLLRNHMGHQAFLQAVAAAQRLSPRTANFWRQLLKMEGIPCAKKYYRNTAWSC